uniref:PPM-type phosphatase domain-containing protein n=2 Tax=Alexandrium monilatum TaxID=311494 RepID=A0A7S4VM37_9DINO
MADKADDGRTAEEVLAAAKKTAKTFRGTYIAGTSKIRGRTSAALAHQQGEGKDAQGSIFSRPHLQGSDWPPELEKVFRRHINAELYEYIRKAFRRNAAREADGAADRPAASVPAAEVPPEGGAAPAALSARRDVSLASALPEVMPPDRPVLASPRPLAPEAPARQRYVPPHLRQASAEVKEAPRQKYVPPFMRRAAERAAAEAAVAEAAEAASGAAVSSPASQSASYAALPTDAVGGNERYGFCVNQGPRASMEDAVDSIAQLEGAVPSEFYAVYDGHGGTEAVQFVKRRLPTTISSHDGFNDPSRIDEVLQEAFTHTDEELLKHLQCQRRAMGRSHGSEGTYVLSSGCVGCIAIVRGADVIVANLGDCRALMCCKGDMKPLTVDHRPDENDGERERLQGLGVEVSNDGYLHGCIGVSRAFGDWAWDAEEKCRGLIGKPEVSRAEVTDDTEFLLLGCDGVFEKITSKEAGQIVRRRLRTTGDAKAAAEGLVRHAVKRGGSDNVSAVVVLFKRPPVEAERTAPRLFGGNLPALAAEEPPPEAPDCTG